MIYITFIFWNEQFSYFSNIACTWNFEVFSKYHFLGQSKLNKFDSKFTIHATKKIDGKGMTIQFS